MQTTTRYKPLFLLPLVFTLISCKKFVDVPPPATQIVSSKAFENDGTATRAVVGIYIEMMRNISQFSSAQTTFYAGLSGDELYFYQNDAKQEFLKNEITQINHDLISVMFWNPAYRYIYSANSCLEGLSGSQTLSPSVRNTLVGESKFIRAYCYFYLVNLFGDVPLVTTTDYEVNSLMPRTSTNLVFEQIIKDLLDAQNLLPSAYPTQEKVRPNKWTAAALLARAYLYKGDWSNAEQHATSVISSGAYTLPQTINNVFLKTSTETIFQLMPGSNNINSWEGSVFIPASPSVTPTYLCTPTLLNSFEVGDSRRSNWIQSRVFAGQNVYYPYKYKIQQNAVISEYYILLRLAEQYLIRAEARAHLNNITGSRSDLNIIRNRAGLINTLATDKQGLLSAIEHERRVELFAEWGHRWFDLKRTNRAAVVLSALKPSTWQSTDILWPIPSGQILLNPSLIQNPGY